MLSIIIISCNQRRRLLDCLDSLANHPPECRHEIIWVDNGSTDGSAEMVAQVFPQVIICPLPENQGVAPARNVGISRASGEYLLLLDDDTLPKGEVIDSLVSHLDRNPRCGICAPALIDADGTLQDSYKPFPGLGIKLRNVLQLPLPANEKPIYVIGACQMIRAAMLAQTGPLDDAIFYGPEDADLCLRAVAHGWSVDYLPSLRLIHLWRRATRRSPLSPLGRAHIKGLLHFWRKHRRLF